MGTLHIVTTVIAGVVLAALVAAVGKSFDEDRLTRWLKGAIGGTAFIAANMLAPAAPAVVGLLVGLLPLGCFAYLFVWWAQEGSSGKELVLFILISIMLSFNVSACMARIVELTVAWVVRGLVMSIPSIVWLMLIAFMVSNMIAFRQRLKAMSSENYEGGDEDEEDDECN